METKEKSVRIPLNSEHSLERVVKAVEDLHLRCFEEEGDCSLYFNMGQFPPNRLPAGTETFKTILTRGNELKDFQRQALIPWRLYGHRKYYLLGKLHSDADQILPALKDIRMISPHSRILTGYCSPQDTDYYFGRLPEVSLYALRENRAIVTFSLAEDNFEAQTPNSKRAGIERVLTASLDQFKKIYHGENPTITNLGERVRQEHFFY